MGARVFGWEERILIGRDEFAARKRLLESRASRSRTGRISY
jgi:hypothetical protein